MSNFSEKMRELPRGSTECMSDDQIRRVAQALLDKVDDARDAEVARLRQISRENLQTLAAERERCKRWGKPHHELDAAIRDTRTALNGGDHE